MQLNLIKTGSYFTLLFLIVFSYSCKKENTNTTPSQLFHYEFIGFEAWSDKMAPFNDIMENFKNFDYIINKQEVLLPIPKNEPISIDSLNDYHKLIHKVELFSTSNKYSQGDIKMVINYFPQSETSTSAFQYIKYIYSETEGWELKYNLGKHLLAGLPNNKENRIRFLATEIARASFK